MGRPHAAPKTLQEVQEFCRQFNRLPQEIYRPKSDAQAQEKKLARAMRRHKLRNEASQLLQQASSSSGSHPAAALKDSGGLHPAASSSVVQQASEPPAKKARVASCTALASNANSSHAHLAAEEAGAATASSGSGGAYPAALPEQKRVLWMVLEESRYDAIANGTLHFEARPKYGELPLKPNKYARDADMRDPSFEWCLARKERSVILQRGTGTGAYRKHAKTLHMEIEWSQVYGSAHSMLTKLAAELFVNNTNPIKFYTDLYGAATCAHAFVAMKFRSTDQASL